MKPISTVIIETGRKEMFDNIIEQYANIDTHYFGISDDERIPDFDIMIVDIPADIAKKTTDDLIRLLIEVRKNYPDSCIMLCGKVQDTLKKQLKPYIDIVSGTTPAKVGTDFATCLTEFIKRNDKLLKYLTHFFAPHLVGDYGRKGFEQLLNEVFSREENLLALEDLKKRYNVISPLLLEENRKLIEDALTAYEERDLSDIEIQEIENAFYFQFNTLNALENFNERRLYYLETDVIFDVWHSVIDFGRELGGGLIFGCSRNGDTIRLKIAVNNVHNLTKIGKKSYFYSKLELIEPYGDLIVSCEDKKIVIGKDREEAIVEEGNTVFDFFIKIIIPERRRRGLMRF